MVKTQAHGLFPFALGWLERTINRLFAPLLPWFGVSAFLIARPRASRDTIKENLSVTVLVPARANEAGNIEAAITRTPAMGK